MTEYILSFKPAIGNYGLHDPSAVLFKNGELIFGVEEERLNRRKHAEGDFPINAIRMCLDQYDLDIDDIDQIVLPYEPSLQTKILPHELSRSVKTRDSALAALDGLFHRARSTAIAQFAPSERVRQRLASEFNAPIPDIEAEPHHACHAASAFHPTDFEETLVLTIDGKGEYDSTVVWKGTPEGIERIETYNFPNSLGHFYGVVTEFLGYRAFNGEGKIMGLAPYGNDNSAIRSSLSRYVDTSADYDVTELTNAGIDEGVSELERILGRSRKEDSREFNQWEEDLAFVTQSLLEETVVNIVEKYLSEINTSNVCIAGGVALNCKMNKRVMEADSVEQLFVQPVAHDAGLAVGAGLLSEKPKHVPEMTNVYWGPEYDNHEIGTLLEKNKIDYRRPDNLTSEIASEIADGAIVGWFQGRLEMGPRALGHRSILADPRTVESRDRVNKYVKHREEWRPFAPSILEERADEYLVNSESTPYMIKTFDTVSNVRDDITAVLHPGDNTTRPQTVSKEENPRYYELISEFENLTGVPVLLNTSFNDHGEPIVNTPTEAIKDFFGMGIDVLVVNDLVLEK